LMMMVIRRKLEICYKTSYRDKGEQPLIRTYSLLVCMFGFA
jgi:hypothetical protein